MARHWRCGNRHDWVGDLGALTFCPVCGSADVYEVRGPMPAAPAIVPPPPKPSGTDVTTLILPPTAAPKPTADVEPTWNQPPPNSAAPRGDAEAHLSTSDWSALAESPAATPTAVEVIEPVHEQITRELPAVPPNGHVAPTASNGEASAHGLNGSLSDFGRGDTWLTPPETPATSIVGLPPSGPAVNGHDTENAPGSRKRWRPSPQHLPHVAGYEVLGILGRGGMGVVYKAKQTGLNRLVALKMVLGGVFADSTGQSRFRAEAEAIASLHHPNIVQVYDIGEHDGLPYFSLEYLDGGSLHERLAGQPQPPRDGAALIEQLARAVQYAHERGVVHRDLKPGNILFANATHHSPLTTHQPKITDFGLARRIGSDSSLTGTGIVLGTPSYMAPEQAEGRSDAIGPPADIHALGAILYEMLTGRPPFLAADPTATVMQVRLMEPVPPRRSQPAVQRDLETITLKCLQKEPHKRYASAGALADDLQRFLSGSPILARPVSVWEKVWKWAKRSPAMAGLTALSIFVVIGLSVGGPLVASREHGLRTETEVQRDRAAQNFESARDAVDRLMSRVTAGRVGRVPLGQLRNELYQDVLEFQRRFLVESNDPAVRQEAARAYSRVGKIHDEMGQREEAIADYRKAVQLFAGLEAQFPNIPAHRSDLANTLRLCAVVLEAVGRGTEADRSTDQARKLLTQLVADHPKQPEYRERLAELLNDWGSRLSHRRIPAAAEQQLRAALEEFDRLCDEFPTAIHTLERARVQSSLGALLLSENRVEPALQLLRAAVDNLGGLVFMPAYRFQQTPDLGRALDNLGAALLRAGHVPEAEDALRAAVDRFAASANEFPTVPEYRYAQAIALENLAHVRKTVGGLRAAEPDRARAREQWEWLIRKDPDNADFQLRYALSLDEKGIYLEEIARNRADAMDAVSDALGRLEKLVAANPLDPRVTRELARRHLNLGILLTRSGQEPDAEGHYNDARSILEGVLAGDPTDDTARLDLITVYTNRAALTKFLGRPKDEEWSWRHIAELQDQRVQAHPTSADLAADLARTQFALAGLRGDKPESALPALREAVDRQRAALALAPARRDLAADLAKFGNALIGALVDEKAHAAAAHAVGQLEADLPPNWDGWPHIAGLLIRCVRLAREDAALSDDARTQAVRSYGEQAISLLRKSVAAGRLDAATVRSGEEWESLRTGPEFREAFAQLIADAEARAKGGGG